MPRSRERETKRRLTRSRSRSRSVERALPYERPPNRPESPYSQEKRLKQEQAAEAGKTSPSASQTSPCNDAAGRSTDRSNRQSRSTSRSRASDGRSRSRSRSRSPQDRSSNTSSNEPGLVQARIYVGHLPTDKMARDDLKEIFEPHGKILGYSLHKGFGFVQFSNKDEADAARLKEDGRTFRGQKIIVRIGKGQDQRKEWSDRDRLGGREAGDRDFRQRDYRERFDRDQEQRTHGSSRNAFGSTFFRGGGLRRGGGSGGGSSGGGASGGGASGPAAGAGYNSVAASSAASCPPTGSIDCLVVGVGRETMSYARMMEVRLKRLGMLTELRQVDEPSDVQPLTAHWARFGCYFAVTATSQNEIHRSVTVNILQGTAEEHRNMPLDNAMGLLDQAFGDLVLSQTNSGQQDRIVVVKPGAVASNYNDNTSPWFIPIDRSMIQLLGMLVNSQYLTVAELDDLIGYLQLRRRRVAELEANRTMQMRPPPYMGPPTGQPGYQPEGHLRNASHPQSAASHSYMSGPPPGAGYGPPGSVASAVPPNATTSLPPAGPPPPTIHMPQRPVGNLPYGGSGGILPTPTAATGSVSAPYHTIGSVAPTAPASGTAASGTAASGVLEQQAELQAKLLSLLKGSSGNSPAPTNSGMATAAVSRAVHPPSTAATVNVLPGSASVATSTSSGGSAYLSQLPMPPDDKQPAKYNLDNNAIQQALDNLLQNREIFPVGASSTSTPQLPIYSTNNTSS